MAPSYVIDFTVGWSLANHSRCERCVASYRRDVQAVLEPGALASLLFLHLPSCEFQREFITLDRRISLAQAS
jgi:hypothetical protein